MPAKTTVLIHIGTPKTGTTLLQATCWDNAVTLAKRGLHLPGRNLGDHFRAAQDIRQEAFREWKDPSLEGTWNALLRDIAAAPAGSRVLVTHEILADASPAAVARVLADLSAYEVHVVCTARDLGRQVPSVWQEDLKNGYALTYEEFLDALSEEPPGPLPLTRVFWGFQELPRVLGTWGAGLPPERVHVVTVPQRGAPSDLLWQRFASVLGVDPRGVQLSSAFHNSSLGYAEAELLRGVNAALADRLAWPEYERHVKQWLAGVVLGSTGSTPVRLPAQALPWVTERAERFIAEIEASGYAVVGDLGELRPDPGADGALLAGPAAVEPAAEQVIARLLLERQYLTSVIEGSGDYLGRTSGRDMLRHLKQRYGGRVVDRVRQHLSA